MWQQQQHRLSHVWTWIWQCHVNLIKLNERRTNKWMREKRKARQWQWRADFFSFSFSQPRIQCKRAAWNNWRVKIEKKMKWKLISWTRKSCRCAVFFPQLTSKLIKSHKKSRRMRKRRREWLTDYLNTLLESWLIDWHFLSVSDIWITRWMAMLRLLCTHTKKFIAWWIANKRLSEGRIVMNCY